VFLKSSCASRVFFGIGMLSTFLRGASTQLVRIAIARGAIFFAFWLMISGGSGTLLAVGIVAVTIATWISVRLLPDAGLRLRPFGMARLAVHVLRQSAIAGADVARRVFHPVLALHLGFIVLPLRLPISFARSAFCALSSLQAGALPAGTDANDRLMVHCLDIEQPVAANMAAEQTLFVRALRDA
jgi:multicomponent Na+:H+ antiporter subunit E